MTGTWASGWSTGDIVTAAEYKKSAGSIFDSTLGGAAANIDITSIVATYAHLLVTLYARSDTAALSTTVQMRFNNDSAANYDYQFQRAIAASSSAGEIFAGTSLQTSNFPGNTATANCFGVTQIWIPHYAGTANNKQFVASYGNKFGVTTTTLEVGSFMGGWRSTAAINRITLIPVAGNFMAGTRCTVYAMGA